MTSAIKKNALLSEWEKTLVRRADAAAVYSTQREVLRSFADIEAEARQFEAALAEFQRGDVIAIQIGNSPQWPALVIACMRLGLIPLPLGRHIEKVERDTALETCGAAGIVEPKTGAPAECRRVAHGNGTAVAPQCDFLKLSSASRAICFQAEQLVSDCENIVETMGLTEDDLNFGVIPFSHSYGFSNLITPLLCRGVPLVASEDRMPRAILNDLARTGATVFPGMPVFYQMFADMRNLPDLPRLRLCISAGAPLMKNVAMRFTEKFGRKIHTFYGASECGGISYDVSAESDYTDGFLGEPIRNVRVEHCAETSRIRITSGAVADGYHPTPDPEVLGGGSFTPGDLVEKIGHGFFVRGRVSDLINVAGRKLNPAEVEAPLLRFPGVKEAVVFGVPSTLRNEEAIACVVADSTLKRDELLRFAHTVLSAWQVPKDIWLVDSIPSDGNRKCGRSELARRYISVQHSKVAHA